MKKQTSVPRALFTSPSESRGINALTFTLRAALGLLCILLIAANPQEDFSSTQIWNVQTKLSKFGYEPGICDGKWGRQTSRAVREFQQDNRLEATGELDEKTYVAIMRKTLNTIQGSVESLYADGQKFAVHPNHGSKESVFFTERTQFTADSIRVSHGRLRNGVEVKVTYIETYGSGGIGSGWVPIINRAVRVEFLDSINMSEEASPSRFIDNGDGTISDRETGLMWQKGQADLQMTHSAALDYASQLRLGGYDNWRLPAYKEITDAVLIKLGPRVGSSEISDATFWTQEANGKIFIYDPSVDRSAVVFGSNDAVLLVRCVRDSSVKPASSIE